MRRELDCDRAQQTVKSAKLYFTGIKLPLTGSFCISYHLKHVNLLPKTPGYCVADAHLRVFRKYLGPFYHLDINN